MSQEASPLIFIDANQYLDLYRISQGKKLLDALNEQQRYIFVTKQIRDEVQRRKLQEAITFFKTQLAAVPVRALLDKTNKEQPNPGPRHPKVLLNENLKTHTGFTRAGKNSGQTCATVQRL